MTPTPPPWLALLLATLVGVSGCDDPPAPPTSAPAATTAAATAPAATATPTARVKGRRDRGAERRRGGPQMMVKLALRKLELTDQQRKALEALGGGKEAKGDREASTAALAEAVRSGSLDVDALEKRAPAKHAEMVARLGELHATLTPEQRQQLVTIMRDRGGRGRREGKEPRDRTKKGKRSAVNKLLRGLEVTAEQRTKIDEALLAAKLGSEHEGSGAGKRKREEHEALLDAFAKDDFDANAALGAPEAAKYRRYLERLAVIVPLLDEAQRGKLADRIAAGKGKRRP